MAGVKRVENRVDELEEKLEAVQAELRKLDIEQLQAGINKIPLLEESLGILIKKIDNLDHTAAEPSTNVSEGLQQPPTTGSGKEKGTQLDLFAPTSGSALDSLPRRLELPVFEGLNPEGWLFRVERYFELNNLSLAEKLRSAVVCFEGEALSWYYYEEGRRPFRSWDELKIQLLERFQLTQEGALRDQLFSLQQTTTVREYRCQFEVLSAPLSELSESVLEIIFRKGLQADIRAELRLMGPVGLPKMMRMAQQIEDKNMAIQLHQSGSNYSKQHHNSSGTNFSKNVARQPPVVSSSASPVQPSAKTPATSKFRRLSEAEMLEKREKGLCFRCDEKFGPGHRCKKKELQVLWVHGDEHEMNESNDSYEETIMPDDYGGISSFQP